VTTAFDPDELVAHAEGVRALARRLLADANAADDVVQDACLAALTRPPADDTPRRAWFVAVVKNLARRTYRGDARRGRREHAVARSEAVPAAAHVAGEIEAHRRLVDAVASLDEPYRGAVVLRYFDGLAPREIAERLGVAAATVSTWIHRGVAMLRARLERDRDDWRAALLPLFAVPRPRVSPASIVPVLGVAAMTVKQATVAAALALLLLAGGAAFVASRGRTPVDPAAARTPLDVVQPTTRAPRPRIDDKPPDAAVDATTPSPAAAATPAARDLTVLVVDPDRKPVAGVVVHVNTRGGPRDAVRETTSDKEGRAKFQLLGELVNAWAQQAGADERAYKHKGPPVPIPPTASQVELVVERWEWISGSVVDADGKPIDRAELVAIRDGLHVWGDWSYGGKFRVAVPPRGVYDIALNGWIAGRPRDAKLPELYGEAQGVAPGATDVKLVARPAIGKGSIHVRAVTSDGRPLADVNVVVTTPHTWNMFGSGRTDIDGRFSCKDVPEQRVRVDVETDWRRTESWEAAGWIAPPQEHLVRPSEDEVVLVFEAGRPIHGRIEFPASFPAQPDPKFPVPIMLVNVEQDGRTVSRTVSGQDKRFTAWVPVAETGPFRLVCGARGDDGRSFDASVDGVRPGDQDVLLTIVETPR